MLKKILSLLISGASLFAGGAVHALPLNSRNALLIEEGSGHVLLEKNANEVVPIASLTKLMTAMVVLDANRNLDETIVIDDQDVDVLKHSRSRVPVGVTLARGTVLELALMSSDNRAAAALARTFPGGISAFTKAVRNKVRLLGLQNTIIVEPTGLSPQNSSTAHDMAKIVMAASKYPEIVRLTTGEEEVVDFNGHEVTYKNTNKLVGKDGWDIRLSKTGYTNEAGRCIVMRVRNRNENFVMVLLNSQSGAARSNDAIRLKGLIGGGVEGAAKLSRVNFVPKKGIRSRHSQRQVHRINSKANAKKAISKRKSARLLAKAGKRRHL